MTIQDKTFARIEKLFEVGIFADVKVLIAGCGSGGSAVALHLVMAGVRNLTLLDNDELEVENVIRHICGRRYIGERKVNAVADVLLDRNPNASIRKLDEDIQNFPGLEAEVKAADVVVIATDNEPTRYQINALCVQHRKPFVVARVFTRGIGGEAFAFRPGTGGCLACLETFLERSPFREGIREIELVSEEEREQVYGMEVDEIKDSPGLSLDIGFITGFHARFVLDAIARGLSEPPKYFEPIPENYVVWGNRPHPPFSKHFQLQRIHLTPRENCGVCAQGGDQNG
jgi:molybdopterin-synthase adenylyltransferase